MQLGELFEFTAHAKANSISGTQPSASRTATLSSFSADVSLGGVILAFARTFFARAERVGTLD